MNKVLFATPLLLLCILLNSPKSFATNPLLSEDTTHISFRQQESNVKLTNEAETILVRKGDVLKIDLGESDELIQVRIHSSLGRLIKHFKDVTDNVSMQTDDLQPGIYMVIIKRLEEREIKRVLITDAERE